MVSIQPKRELLSLLLKELNKRPIFDGPVESRYLVYNSTDSECTIIGEPSGLDGTEQCHVADCWVLQACQVMRRKKKIVEEYLKWYIIHRNNTAIERFKAGLERLQFLTALQQHPTVLTPVLCHCDVKLSAAEMENLFQPELSQKATRGLRKRRL
ncbi:hypothetical protein D5F01_LYC24016 [Larimichthys crocea]|uniref:Uncharacterized protein n=1 Tax=Larimichthys crocea TaxID=215358 RepID=A0A6G0HFF9_LARCR|nr:hypothetical protein D5F01_LYC24016 [Larimichthys crocea]